MRIKHTIKFAGHCFSYRLAERAVFISREPFVHVMLQPLQPIKVKHTIE
jgi:hypothetical protein